jgi:hypothetical protein
LSQVPGQATAAGRAAAGAIGKKRSVKIDPFCGKPC